MNKLQALNWLVENVTRWPSKGKGVVFAPINWFWGGFTDGEVKLIKAEPTAMYADCHITQQEWLDVDLAAHCVTQEEKESWSELPPEIKPTPQEVYRKFDEQTVESLRQRDIKYRKPQKIYIAGPMTGYENFNRDAFNCAADKMSLLNFIALNPAILPDGLTQPEYMQICLVMVMCADAIYLLKGWDESKGAQAELSLAEKLGLEVIEEE